MASNNRKSKIKPHLLLCVKCEKVFYEYQILNLLMYRIIPVTFPLFLTTGISICCFFFTKFVSRNYKSTPSISHPSNSFFVCLVSMATICLLTADEVIFHHVIQSLFVWKQVNKWNIISFPFKVIIWNVSIILPVQWSTFFNLPTSQPQKNKNHFEKLVQNSLIVNVELQLTQSTQNW